VELSVDTQWSKLTLRTWAGLLTLGLALWLIITQLEMIMEMIWVLLGALLIGLAIRPVADFLTRWRIPRGFTVLGAYMVVVALFVLLGVLLIPIISAEVSQLQANGPALLQKALSQVTAIPLVKNALPSSGTLVQSLAQRMDTVVNTMAGAVAGLSTLTVDVLVALIIGYFFATDVDLFERLSARWIPQHHRARIRPAVAHLQRQLTRWVWARLIVAVYFGVVSGAGLALFGVPYALTISLVGAVLEIVPYLGGAAVPLAAVSALTVRPISVLGIALFYVVVIEIKGHVIEPALYGRAMGLHPGIVLVALVVGLKVGGVIGVLFAVPVTVVLIAVLDQVWPMLAGSEAQIGEQVLQEDNTSGQSRS
jgi:predicted PurR-regulated permease PerM